MSARAFKINIEEDSAIPDHLQVARQIERMIRTGVLKEGDRLPSTTQLIRMTGLNIARIQRAMDILVNAGLLQRFPRRGTFVTPKSLRLSVAILSGANLLRESNHFARWLLHYLDVETTKRGFNPRLYEVSLESGPAQLKRSLGEIAYDFRHQQFAGIILTGGISEKNIPVFVRGKFPLVRFGTSRELREVSIDSGHFARTAVKWLAAHNCREIVMLGDSLSELGKYDPKIDRHITGFEEAMAELGLPWSARSEQPLMTGLNAGTVSVAGDRMAYESTLQIIAKWQRANSMPDGLIVFDDIQTRGVAAAVLAAWPDGIKKPKIVTQSNEGVDQFYVLPVGRYRIPVSQIAREILDRLVAKALKETVPNEVTLIRGVMSEEFQ